MSRTLKADIDEWAKEMVRNAHKSGFSPINTFENLLRNPVLSTGGSKHRILYWHRNKRIARMSRAMHQIDKLSQILLIVDSGYLESDDKTVFTLENLRDHSTMKMHEIREIIRDAKQKLRKILRAK